MKGWILDLYPDLESGKMVVWLRDQKKCYKVKEDYRCSFYIGSREGSYDEVKKYYEDENFDLETVVRKTDLFSGEKKELLKITPEKLFDPEDQLEALRFFKGFDRYRFYNVDIPLDQRYMIEKNVKPFSLVEKDGGWKSLEKGSKIHYSKPELRKLSLKIKPESENFRKKKDKLSSVKIDGGTVEGEEGEILTELDKRIERKDPDIIFTSGGDVFGIPYLAHRAEMNNIDLKLGREKALHPPKNGSWYESYGRVVYRPPSYPLKGRIHIDTENSFLYDVGELEGLIEVSRISKVPLQRLSRRSPGSLINAMEIEQALREGYLVPWKINLSENFKDSIELLKADRGGHIFDPEIGFHEDVIKLDFASMYPSIIDEYNLSPETLEECFRYQHKVPELGYRVCEGEKGVTPKVVEPLIKRRQEYKQLQEKNEKFEKRADILKWLLVTCFGYTGYKKARFNCIEVHESITAYGREMLLKAAQTAQEMGFKVLHGIVDSVWLKGEEDDIPLLLEEVKKKTKLELEKEGTYQWIVFPENKSDGAGALNHYFGVFEGELEVKGLAVKRSDTPEYMKEVQMDILRVIKKIRKREEIKERMTEIIEILKEKRKKLKNRRVEPEKLYFTKTSSKKAEDYAGTTEMKSALTQYREMGFPKDPGQIVNYLVTDSGSRDLEEKVKVKEKDPYLYDTDYYEENLFRVAEEVLSPFGYDKKEIRKRVLVGV